MNNIQTAQKSISFYTIDIMKHQEKYYAVISLNGDSNHPMNTVNNDLGHYFQINI